VVDRNSLYGPLDPAPDAGWEEAPPRMGFFTDTSVCIGCKACEVACKEWNLVPEDGIDLLGMSYDNTGMLGASSWRHVAFIEQPVRPGQASSPFADLPTGLSGAAAAADVTEGGVRAVDAELMGTDGADLGVADAAREQRRPGQEAFLGMPSFELPGREAGRDPLAAGRTDVRWLMASDVCKHCTHAACLDVCPTGSLFRTEFGTVVVQEDICNGCGYCIPACPYGVIDQRKDDGRAWKCTLCYDRIGDGLEPACAKACPTDSIQYGPVDELRERAAARLEQLHEAGVPEAQLYGHDPEDGVGGTGAFFLLLDEPEVYGLPPDPVVTTRDLPAMWKRAALAGAAMVAAAVVAFAGGGA
jgi:formate dehydrogenase iron-sulfur subunit